MSQFIRTVNMGHAELKVPSLVLCDKSDLASGCTPVSLNAHIFHTPVHSPVRVHSQSGKLVLLPTPATEPQGAWLSAAADQTLSGGHMKAAGPMSSCVDIVEYIFRERKAGEKLVLFVLGGQQHFVLEFAR